MVTVVTGLQLNELLSVHWDSLSLGGKTLTELPMSLARWLFHPKTIFEHDATFDEHMFQMAVEQTTKIGYTPVI